ncbi:MAG TPA: hypothetical protein VN673_08050 [Clostridia bacterium]|nr:hypothetical protein [Clostridia bacterium]
MTGARWCSGTQDHLDLRGRPGAAPNGVIVPGGEATEVDDGKIVRIRMDQLELRRPRQ